MKKNKKYKSRTSFAILIIFVIILTVLGISAIVNAYIDARDRLVYEHQKHIYAMVYSADKSFCNLEEQCNAKINYLKTLTAEAEKELYATGNIQPMSEIFRDLVPLKSDFITDLLLLDGDKVLLSLDPDKHQFYTFLNDGNENSVVLCENEYGEKMLAFLYPSATGRYLFSTLIDIDMLNHYVVGEELISDYWLILFNPDSDLWLENDKKKFDARIQSAEEAVNREDGYSLLVESEKTEEPLAISYEYMDSAKKEQTALFVTIPSAKSKNRLFAIGVAEEATEFVSVARVILWKTIGASVLIMLGFFHLAFYLLKANKETNDLLRQTKLLEEQNKAKQELLDKQSELMHRQRLETIGTLTTGIAHEFNNLLTPIMGYSIMSMEKVSDNEELMENLNTIYEASSKAKALISRLSELSRNSNVSSYTEISPDELITKVCQIVKLSVPENVELICDLHCPDKCLYANETQIAQLCLNITINALHAMEGRVGMLTISTGMTEKNVVFRFADMGAGIPENMLPHLFEPFFTTKEKGHGTGLGLAISKQIVDEHGGTISVDTKPGYGTTFTVVFPNKAGKKDTTIA